MTKIYRFSRPWAGFLLAIAFSAAGCSGSPAPAATAPAASNSAAPTAASGYPVPAGYPAPAAASNTQDQGYPGASLPVTQLPTTAEPPTSAPQPNAGQASLAGALFSIRINRALPGTMLYITRGVGPDHRAVPGLITGPEAASGDLSVTTDAKGQFAINNIAPGTYYMFVSAPLAWVPGQLVADNYDPQPIELKADERRLLGVIYAAWP